MNFHFELSSPDLQKMVRNAHFWIIIAITAFITFIYYDWYDRYNWFWYFSIWEGLHDITGSLFLIPFIYACLVFWWRLALIIWLLSFLAIFPRIMLLSFTVSSLMHSIAIALFPAMVVITVSLELKWREGQKQLMANREQQQQLYMAQIIKAQEDERQRISQELHDGAIQELLAVANRAQSMIPSKESETTLDTTRDAEWIRDAILRITEDVHRLSFDLRPSILDNLGLVPSLRWLANHLQQDSEISVKFMVNGSQRKLSSETQVTIFRIVQEALNNVKSHSNASKVMLSLTSTPESIKVIVQDDGKGFRVNRKGRMLTTEHESGLIGMQQRAESLNGTFSIDSHLDKGTTICFEIPNY